MIDRGKGWFQTPDTVIELSGARYNAEFFSYLVMAMPLALVTERFDQIKYGRRADIDSLDFLYLSKADTMLLVIGIDPDDHLVKHVEGVVTQGDSQFAFVNHFAGYQEYDGYILPTRMTNISMGLRVGESTLEKAEINPNIGEDLFAPRKATRPYMRAH